MIAIIQCRLSSKRLKNKALIKINKSPIIWHVYNSLKKSKKLKKIVVATSKNKSDDLLVKFLKNNKIAYYRGDLKNVAQRLYKCAEKYHKNYFVRISGDSPLIDYKIVDKCIDIFYKNRKIDLITNTFPRTFSQGQSVEIVKSSIIRNNNEHMDDFEKEHVTTYFYKNFKKFKIKNFKSRKKNRKKMSVDTKKDLQRIKKIIQ